MNQITVYVDCAGLLESGVCDEQFIKTFEAESIPKFTERLESEMMERGWQRIFGGWYCRRCASRIHALYPRL